MTTILDEKGMRDKLRFGQGRTTLHSVWAVIYEHPNFDDRIEALYDNEAAAQKHCSSKNERFYMTCEKRRLRVLQIQSEFLEDSAS